MNYEVSHIYQPSYYAKAKIILNVRRWQAKDGLKLRVRKKYQRTNANRFFQGFLRKQRRIYANKKRISVSKRAIYWSNGKEPIT
jgi:hypothetical protein